MMELGDSLNELSIWESCDVQLCGLLQPLQDYTRKSQRRTMPDVKYVPNLAAFVAILVPWQVTRGEFLLPSEVPNAHGAGTATADKDVRSSPSQAQEKQHYFSRTSK